MKRGVALVTGGTRGIGKAIALRLAADGYVTIVSYLANERAAGRMHARGIAAIRADVSQSDEAEALVREVLRLYRRIDVLVNNVGPLVYKGWLETGPEEWRAQFEGNLHSAFYCARIAAPAMRKRGVGAIVNIGSPAAQVVRGVPGATAYAIAKTGVLMFTKTLARTEGKHGIRVNAVSPGYIRTADYPPPEDAPDMIRQVPLGRLGRPAEVAEAVAWLVSPAAAYVNGAVIDVGGGLWA